MTCSTVEVLPVPGTPPMSVAIHLHRQCSRSSSSSSSNNTPSGLEGAHVHMLCPPLLDAARRSADWRKSFTRLCSVSRDTRAVIETTSLVGLSSSSSCEAASAAPARRATSPSGSTGRSELRATANAMLSLLRFGDLLVGCFFWRGGDGVTAATARGLLGGVGVAGGVAPADERRERLSRGVGDSRRARLLFGSCTAADGEEPELCLRFRSIRGELERDVMRFEV